MASFIFNVTFDCADPRRLARFWSEVTGYQPAEESDGFVRLRAPDSRGVRHLLFYKVPEPKQTKNRMHVDLATKDGRPQEIERLTQLGASELATLPGWTVMADPEGNEFCLG